MKNNRQAIEHLQHVQRRFETFKLTFTEFQREILRLGENNYPVSGIEVQTVSDTVSSVTFIGRSYEIEFSTTSIDNAQKGKVTCFRRIDEDERLEVSSITYDGQALVDIEPPEGDDPIYLNEDICSALIVLNWLYQDADA